MNKGLILFKIATLISLLIASYFILRSFLYFNLNFDSDSLQLKINWMATIFFFIGFFYIIFFLIDFRIYNLLFGFITIIGSLVWVITYFLDLFNYELGPVDWKIIRYISIILCFTVFAPGFSLNMIKFIRNNSNQDRKKRVFKNFHIHEGFVGILFVVIALLLWILRSFLIQHEIMRKKLRIFLAVDMILLFLFLFSGSFLISRDRRDLIKFKFIENRNIINHNYHTTVFSPLTSDSIKFFKSPPILLYPVGILLTSFSINMVIHGTDFLPKEIFSLTHEKVVLLGFLLCFVSGALIGLDWYRLFARFYPKLYYEVENVLENLKELK